MKLMHWAKISGPLLSLPILGRNVIGLCPSIKQSGYDLGAHAEFYYFHFLRMMKIMWGDSAQNRLKRKNGFRPKAMAQSEPMGVMLPTGMILL